jgi:hypothetical protein
VLEATHWSDRQTVNLMVTRVAADSPIPYTDERSGKSAVASGYRGQLHYEGDDQAWDGFRFFPDLPDGAMV